MTYSFRHDELAVLLGKIIGTEQDVPEDKFYTVVTGVTVALTTTVRAGFGVSGDGPISDEATSLFHLRYTTARVVSVF